MPLLSSWVAPGGRPRLGRVDWEHPCACGDDDDKTCESEGTPDETMDATPCVGSLSMSPEIGRAHQSERRSINTHDDCFKYHSLNTRPKIVENVSSQCPEITALQFMGIETAPLALYLTSILQGLVRISSNDDNNRCSPKAAEGSILRQLMMKRLCIQLRSHQQQHMPM